MPVEIKIHEFAEMIIASEVEIITARNQNEWIKKMLDKSCIDELESAMLAFIESWLIWKEQSLEEQYS